MAQTKRKRQTKHRGNAAGGIEARGRTGKGSAPKAKTTARRSRPARGAVRPNKPPTWKGVLGKSAFMVLLLFGVLQLGILAKGATIGTQLLLCVYALVIYVPFTYMTDRFVYKRRLRREGGAPPGGSRK